jgi:hypothetical protein
MHATATVRLIQQRMLTCDCAELGRSIHFQFMHVIGLLNLVRFLFQFSKFSKLSDCMSRCETLQGRTATASIGPRRRKGKEFRAERKTRKGEQHGERSNVHGQQAREEQRLSRASCRGMHVVRCDETDGHTGNCSMLNCCSGCYDEGAGAPWLALPAAAAVAAALAE